MNIEPLTTAEIASNLKYLRERKDFSVKEISAALGITERAYYNYEKGVRGPSLNMLIKIANVYGCSLDDLVSNNVGGTKDSTISFESLRIDNGEIKRRSQTKVTSILDNVILIHDGLNVLTFLRTDKVSSGEIMLIKYKNRFLIGKIYQNEDLISFEDKGQLISLKKKDQEELLIFGLYQGKLTQNFRIDGFF